jgi:hypothetical protein
VRLAPKDPNGDVCVQKALSWVELMTAAFGLLAQQQHHPEIWVRSAPKDPTCGVCVQEVLSWVELVTAAFGLQAQQKHPVIWVRLSLKDPNGDACVMKTGWEKAQDQIVGLQALYCVILARKGLNIPHCRVRVSWENFQAGGATRMVGVKTWSLEIWVKGALKD